MSRLNMRCKSHTWDNLHALKIQLLDLSIVGCIFFIKLARATNRARELSWAHDWALMGDLVHLIEKGLLW